eukprot:5249975-Amphidinium_carterae.2
MHDDLLQPFAWGGGFKPMFDDSQTYEKSSLRTRSYSLCTFDASLHSCVCSLWLVSALSYDKDVGATLSCRATSES